MVELIAKSPVEGLLPVEFGTVSLVGIEADRITAVIAGREADKGAFKEAWGVNFPQAGRSSGKEGARAIWMGPDQCFWIGSDLGELPGFALSDQSDGWMILRLSGSDAEDVLARLVSVDLRPSVFKRGHTARTQLNHMTCSISRVKPDTFDIMVFRSMTQTAVHELSEAMRMVAARHGG